MLNSNGDAYKDDIMEYVIKERKRKQKTKGDFTREFLAETFINANPSKTTRKQKDNRF